MDPKLEALGRILHGVEEEETNALLNALLEARAVHLFGAGRSGLILSAFGARLQELGIPVHGVGTPLAPAFGAEDLLLLCSGSGQSATPLLAAERAVVVGGRVALLTAGLLSPLSRHAHLRVLLPPVMPRGQSGPQIALPGDPEFLQPMRVLFEQACLLYLDGVADTLVRRLGKSARDLDARRPNLH